MPIISVEQFEKEVIDLFGIYKKPKIFHHYREYTAISDIPIHGKFFNIPIIFNEFESSSVKQISAKVESEDECEWRQFDDIEEFKNFIRQFGIIERLMHDV